MLGPSPPLPCRAFGRPSPHAVTRPAEGASSWTSLSELSLLSRRLSSGQLGPGRQRGRCVLAPQTQRRDRVRASSLRLRKGDGAAADRQVASWTPRPWNCGGRQAVAGGARRPPPPGEQHPGAGPCSQARLPRGLQGPPGHLQSRRQQRQAPGQNQSANGSQRALR